LVFLPNKIFHLQKKKKGAMLRSQQSFGIQLAYTLRSDAASHISQWCPHVCLAGFLVGPVAYTYTQ